MDNDVETNYCDEVEIFPHLFMVTPGLYSESKGLLNPMGLLMISIRLLIPLV